MHHIKMQQIDDAIMSITFKYYDEIVAMQYNVIELIKNDLKKELEKIGIVTDFIEAN